MFLIDHLLEHNRFLNIFGIALIIGIAILFSKKRSHISLKLIINAFLIQFALAFAVLKTSLGQTVVAWVADGVSKLYQFADMGIGFVFGKLADINGPWQFIFAIKVLPVIIFFGAFMALLFHFR